MPRTKESNSLTATGTSGALVHSITVSVLVLPYPDFTIAVTTPITIIMGGSATANITVTSINGFVGTVSLTDLVTSGLSCGPITPPTLIGSGIATITCNGLTPGNYTVTITGTSGSLSHAALSAVACQSSSVGGVALPLHNPKLLAPL